MKATHVQDELGDRPGHGSAVIETAVCLRTVEGLVTADDRKDLLDVEELRDSG